MIESAGAALDPLLLPLFSRVWKSFPLQRILKHTLKRAELLGGVY